VFREVRTPIAALFAAGLLVAGCGDGDGGSDTETTSLEDPSFTEAAPEAEPETAGSGETTELEPSEREQVEAAVRSYVAALNARDADRVCESLHPGAVRPRDFPIEVAFAATGTRAQQQARFCRGIVGLTIGRPPPRGGPAWRRTRINELESVSVGGGEARVTATVVHDYKGGDPGIGLEEDVIYLREVDGEWLVVKPSGTFYRAVGFATPPLRALTPP
jgi:hypothetical protein